MQVPTKINPGDLPIRLEINPKLKQNKWWALLGVSILAFTVFMDATMVNAALPFIQTAFKANILQLQWVANIVTIILSMTMIGIGKIADTWGRKRIFYFGVVIFAIAALGAGVSPTIEILILFRGLQALGISTVFIAASALLSDIFPANERVRAISIYGGVTGFGLMIGPFFGGVLIELLNWRWVFWITLPLIALGLCACSFSLRGISRTNLSVKIDWWGLVLLIVGLGALMYGMIEGAEKHWDSVLAWVLLGVGIGALILLIVLDEFRQNPLLDLHIFKEKRIMLAALSCALAGVFSTVFMFFDPLYLRILRKLSPFFVGLLIAVIPAAQTIISLVLNRSVKSFGVTKILLFSIVAAFIAVALHRVIQSDTSLLFLILPFFLLGINWGLSNSATIAAVNQVIPVGEIGEALGTIATIWNILGSIGLAVSTAVFHSVEQRSSFLPAFHRVIEINIAFGALILLSAIGIYINLKKSKTQQTTNSIK